MLRKVILGKGNPAEAGQGLMGNVILLAQPSTGEVQSVLPPAAAAMTDRLAVIFTTTLSEVKRAKPLQVSRSEYLECALLRQKLCYCFADTLITDGRDSRVWSAGSNPQRRCLHA